MALLLSVYGTFREKGYSVEPAPSPFPDPGAHAAGLLSQGVVDLSNDEAHTDQFSISFRPERSPFPLQEPSHKLRGIANGGRGREQSLYKSQLAAFELVATSQPGHIARLYRRIARPSQPQ